MQAKYHNVLWLSCMEEEEEERRRKKKEEEERRRKKKEEEEEEKGEKKLFHQGCYSCSNREIYILSCKIQRQIRTNFVVRWKRQEKLKPVLDDKLIIQMSCNRKLWPFFIKHSILYIYI